MSRYTLIREIFNSFPSSEKGINKLGMHVISLSKMTQIPMYATLEELSSEKLSSLAEKLGLCQFADD